MLQQKRLVLQLLISSRNFRSCLSGQSACIDTVGYNNKLYWSNFCHKIVIRNNSQFKRGCDEMLNHLPYFASGEIVRGFGRGSSELGIPTANFPLEVVKALPAAFTLGIYYGWANVDNGEVHKMVMSIGRNPYYDNKEKSMETHIMHKFDGDLYGRLLKICIVGYIRPERNFESLDDLIHAIKSDIAEADKLLESDGEHRKLKSSKFFTSNCSEATKSTTSTVTTATHLNGDNLKDGS